MTNGYLMPPMIFYNFKVVTVFSNTTRWSQKLWQSLCCSSTLRVSLSVRTDNETLVNNYLKSTKPQLLRFTSSLNRFKFELKFISPVLNWHKLLRVIIVTQAWMVSDTCATKYNVRECFKKMSRSIWMSSGFFVQWYPDKSCNFDLVYTLDMAMYLAPVKLFLYIYYTCNVSHNQTGNNCLLFLSNNILCTLFYFL